MNRAVRFLEARRAFHAALLKDLLTINKKGVVSNADGCNAVSIAIAAGIADLLKAETVGDRMAGQTSGNKFEGICADFVRQTFLKVGHLRPGRWDVHRNGTEPVGIARYESTPH